MTRLVEENFDGGELAGSTVSGSGSLRLTDGFGLAGTTSLKINGNWAPRAQVVDQRHVVLHTLPKTYGELTDDDVKAWYGARATISHRDTMTLIDTPFVDIIVDSDQTIGAPPSGQTIGYLNRVMSDGVRDERVEDDGTIRD